MSFPSVCCNTPPVAASYMPKGERGKLGDFDCYFAGSKESKQGIIVNYDVFGFHSNVLQLCDIIGSLGFYVLLPDLLRGAPLTEADLGKPGVFASFLQHAGSWESNRAAYIQAREHLHNSGVTSVGIIGFCWGGKMVVTALAQLDGFVGGAVVHPALIESGDFGQINAPLLALPSKDEDQAMFAQGFAQLKASKSFGSQCRLEPFEDMFHGFCGARGDWAVPEQAKRANDAIKHLVAFFSNLIPN
ncbi:hypothetical protein H4R26_004690 [Coemansia thaxteri]|uniref:Dienelactone hydrolase domain-containing protein n=1 Tax=Coemansia thaxteri TaxID=2663907 RepID=A0A9W8EDS0_9FUNG|nr:hypothetical protein H4R26_004690 [Coemansia thaxteri]